MKRNNKKGFTITELVIVIAVIAILAAVLIPTFSNVISNAKQSAALQTCSNAMKDYSALAAQEGKPMDTGMAFVNDGFVFVYINSSLHYVGELESLDKIDVDGKYYKSKKAPAISGLTDGATNAAYDIKVNGALAVTVKTTGTETGNTYVLEEKADDHKDENLYFYHTTVNDVEWWGYFTLEGAKDANYQTQGAKYSRMFGAATKTGAADAVSVAIHTEPAPTPAEGTGTAD